MFDSPLIQIALGLMLVFVLFSLLVSSVQEMGVALFKSRSAALWDGIETLLGGGAQAQAARERMYRHPLVRTLIPPSSWSNRKPGVGRRSGPSYMAAGVFSQALIDLLKEPHKVLGALESELTRGLADLRAGDADAAARLAACLSSAVEGMPPDSPLAADLRPRLQALQQKLSADNATVDQQIAAVSTVVALLPAQWKTALSESAGRVSSELEGTIRTLSANTADSIDDLKRAIEQWFDQGMSSVSGWYKRWTMAVQMGIGLVLALALNIDTVNIIRELATNESLRRSLAAQAEAYARTGVIEERTITAEASRGTMPVAVRSAAAGELTLVLPADAVGQPLTVTTSGVDGESPLRCAPSAVADDTAAQGTPGAVVDCTVAADRFTRRTRVGLTVSLGGTPARQAELDVFLVPSAAVQYDQIEQAMQATAVPIGWKDGRLYPEQAEAGLLCVVGWLLTALAGSLGAPFWFDLLKRVANLRSSGPNPTETKVMSPKTA